MKIYFAGSIRGGREDAGNYRQLIQHLKKYGEVLSEHVGENTLSETGENEPHESGIYQRDMDWLLSSDVVVAEVTIPSLGVGYEIGRAVENKKPVLCLYRAGSEKKLSAMIAGCPDLHVAGYSSLNEAMMRIDTFLKQSMS